MVKLLIVCTLSPPKPCNAPVKGLSVVLPIGSKPVPEAQVEESILLKVLPKYVVNFVWLVVLVNSV